MNTGNRKQRALAAAEAYESQKVPTLFEPLARAMLAVVEVPTNARVIDVACGTGVVTRLVAGRLSDKGRISGIDHSAGMIEMARRTMPPAAPTVDWFVSDVADLPFDDGEFDTAFIQQGLQFFPDKPMALAEIARVLAPGGKLYLTCWSTVSPLFRVVSDSLKRRVGDDAAANAVKPFSFRDAAVIESLLIDAGFKTNEPSSLSVERALAPIRPAIREEILAHPVDLGLAERSDDALDEVISDAVAGLEEFRDGERIIIAQTAHLFQAEKL